MAFTATDPRPLAVAVQYLCRARSFLRNTMSLPATD